MTNSKENHDAPNPLVAVLTSPLLWGGVVTAGFYSILPHIPGQQAFLQRYFCSHWVLYATTTLFWIGICILVQKATRLPAQKSAFQTEVLRSPVLRSEIDWQRRLSHVQASLKSLPERLQETELIVRYTDTCDYLAARRTGESLEEHLQYLHDTASDRLHDSYALVRTIIWAIPILGFLGTVLGITMAIANITPDQLDKSLSVVTSGLAVAFDTTALSLSLSMVVVFLSFLIERGEQGVLREVESRSMRELAPLFSGGMAEPGVLEQAEQQAAEHLLARTTEVVNWQTQAWLESLQSIRNRWEEGLQQQQEEFSRAVQAGLQSTLAAHQQQVAAASHDLMGGFRIVSEEFVKTVVSISNALREQQKILLAEQREVWGGVQTALQQLQSNQAEQFTQLVDTLQTSVQGWQGDLQQATATGSAQLQTLHAQGETLLKLVSEESELARLQQTLSDNLATVRAVETIEKTVHSLTAAVHLLTVRSRAA